MFYCNDCAEKNNYPESMSKSHGKCELCGKSRICNNVKNSILPKKEGLAGDGSYTVVVNK